MAIGAVEPLLKWPGGKREIVPQLLSVLPNSFSRYFEPFVGGGALFFALLPRRAILSDSNEELINCYRQVRDDPDGVISRLARMKNSKEEYYRIRTTRPRSPVARAARLIYLTKLSFNGIYRVNRQGQFNVPYGRKTHLRICQPERIREISAVLSGCAINHLDFETAVASAAKGDLVYLDPPYTVAHGRNGFRRYNARIFSWFDQSRLAATAANLARSGCHVIVSNANHQSITQLYKGFCRFTVRRQSRIAASTAHRRPVHELIITNLR